MSASFLAPGPATAGAAAAEEIDDRQQDEGAQERDQQAADREVGGVDGGNAKQRGEQEPGQRGADDPDHDVENDPLLRVRSHHLAGEPAEDAADDNG